MLNKHYIHILNVDEYSSVHEISYVNNNAIISFKIKSIDFNEIIKLDKVKKYHCDRNGYIYHTENFLEQYNKLSTRKKELFINRK